MKRLLITDLDNTLYDWVGFFARSFQAMVRELADLLGEDEELLLDEFQALHRSHGSPEQPFTLLELPAVARHFPGASRRELLHLLDRPLHAFNSTRKQTLRLYESVEETLRILTEQGVVIIGHTESIAANAYYRLQKLGIASHFRHLYALESDYGGHPDPERSRALRPPRGFVHTVPRQERKPNPELLADLCAREGVSLEEAMYVGDSLTRDIAMAKGAGVTAVWARYGTRHDPRLWQTLVRVTHWSPEDVRREEALRERFSEVRPDFTIDAFSDLLTLPGIPAADTWDGPRVAALGGG